MESAVSDLFLLERIRQLEDELAGTRAALHDLQLMKPDEAELQRLRKVNGRCRLLTCYEEVSDMEILRRSSWRAESYLEVAKESLVHTAAKEIGVPPYVVRSAAVFQIEPRELPGGGRIRLAIWVDDLGRVKG